MVVAVRWVGAALLAGACSLEEQGAASSDPGAPDSMVDAGLPDSPELEAGFDAPVEAPADALVDAVVDALVDAPSDAPPSCQSSGACTQALPAGWSPVAVPSNPATACSAGFAPSDLLAQVTASAGACECACNVTKSPACDVGSIQRYISSDASCGTAGVLLSVNGSGCTANAPISLSAYAKGAPLGPSGGTCAATAVEDKSKVAKTRLRACTSAACAENVCQGEVPAGFAACIVKSGDEPTCPTGFASKRTVVGQDFTLGCSACTCDVNGPSKCTGATLSYYSDVACTKLVTTGPVNGLCNANQNAGASANHFKYSATLQQSCAAAGAKTATPALNQLSTVCCK